MIINKKTKRDILDLGDKFVQISEFDRLLIRIGNLEQKVLRRK